MSGRTARSRTPRTPRSAADLATDLEFQQIKFEHEEMQAELLSLRKVAEAISDGGKLSFLHCLLIIG